ncbi:Predicted nicotinamide N-methyase [Pleomorphomonas diazotrophica]|uniref:class I SAM-dependent methyltransferase n=1 Tax=Pleomorphomonas diazotrophica TaxID=1166257 RepID=UPI0008F12BF1|nr:50S ribosomal protein L11 methyltransferase [Pleomorphomonas diazotrophica]SFM56374.1 Predicted nicotinamide N-methyase [Pleomorphomonas diazotrophica]
MSALSRESAFVLRETRLQVPPLVPEISLRLADEAMDLWQATEADLGKAGLPPPFWAFAWAGGQALARHVLDHPDIVRDTRVLDFAAGSGIVALAAKRAGARHVVAADIDPYARAAIRINAADNGLEIEASDTDYLDLGATGFDVVLAGDVFYERPMAARVEPFLRAAQTRGAAVLFGDPGRAYLPSAGIAPLASYDVPVPRAIEDRDVRTTRIWHFI